MPAQVGDVDEGLEGHEARARRAQRSREDADDLSGEVAIMARYQGQVATFRATVPLGADTSNMPEPVNLVDAAVFGKLKQLGIPASDVCDDATFLRRVSLDISGTLPAEEEVRVFMADASPDKRDRLIDRLLDGTAYADHFANKWNFVLRNKKRSNRMS